MSNERKRLLRSRTDRRIGGVCGGVANYLEVDSTVVRIVFLILLLAGSLGFWAYIIIWLFVPYE